MEIDVQSGESEEEEVMGEGTGTTSSRCRVRCSRPLARHELMNSERTEAAVVISVGAGSGRFRPEKRAIVERDSKRASDHVMISLLRQQELRIFYESLFHDAWLLYFLLLWFLFMHHFLDYLSAHNTVPRNCSAITTTTSVLLIVGQKCRLAASYAAPWWVTVSIIYLFIHSFIHSFVYLKTLKNIDNTIWKLRQNRTKLHDNHRT